MQGGDVGRCGKRRGLLGAGVCDMDKEGGQISKLYI